LKRCGLFVMLGLIACSPAPKKPTLLEPFGTAEVPAVPTFVAAEHFIVSHPSEENLGKAPKGVWILMVDDKFKRFFLDKTEKNVSAATLSVHTVVQVSKNQFIVDELGNRAETSLAYLWALLERQPQGPTVGEDGILYIPAWAKPGPTFKPPDRVIMIEPRNVFYIRDSGGNLRSVKVHWYVDPFNPYTTFGWFIDAGELGTEPGRASVADKGYRIFSR
jgi:hypothetical protein